MTSTECWLRYMQDKLDCERRAEEPYDHWSWFFWNGMVDKDLANRLFAPKDVDFL